ncbi:hypothetical protein Scep_003785 [Stephania cephalantha]|uniref:Uncharacterized protein n=1 Tax=Stephania cephalantha TaxID=152367 RepID=A0AAP0PYE0_9MAGN
MRFLWCFTRLTSATDAPKNWRWNHPKILAPCMGLGKRNMRLRHGQQVHERWISTIWHIVSMRSRSIWTRHVLRQ